MKNLLSKLIAGTIIAGTLAGCGNTVRPREFPQGMINGVNYQTMNQGVAPYKLEEQVLFGDREYFEETNKTGVTLPIAIWRYADVTRKIGSKSGKVELETEKTYIPTLVEITNKSGKKTKWAERVYLKTDGPYGLRALMTSLSTLVKETGVSEDKFGYKIVTTEDGASFAIRTIKILNKEYFFPYIQNKSEDEGKFLPYLLIPVQDDKDTNKEAIIEIKNKCGNLSIYNPNQIYRPIETEYLDKLKLKWNKEAKELTNQLIKEGKLTITTNKTYTAPNTNNTLIMNNTKTNLISSGEVINNTNN